MLSNLFIRRKAEACGKYLEKEAPLGQNKLKRIVTRGGKKEV